MSQGKLCHLCVTFSQEHKYLYDEDGDENENYELIIKYFDPECLFMGNERERTTVCLSCWRQIYGFYNFQESIYETQKNLLDSAKEIHILEIGSPEKGKGSELMENADINIKTELESLSGDECTVKSEYNYKPIEVASETPSKEICGTAEKNSTYLLPKLEIVDVYLNDNSFEDADDDLVMSHMEDDSTEKDDSLDVAPAIQQADATFSRRSWTSRHRRMKESDDIIAQWEQNLQCGLCSENCTTYSALQQHFHDNHPLEKCYITCCEKKIHRRYRVEEHIRSHMYPKKFDCDICHKQFKGIGFLNGHMLRSHSKESDSKRKNSDQMIVGDIEMDKLMAHVNFVDHAKVCLECVLCLEKAPTYSLLRQHFRAKHPGTKFYLMCCKQKLIQRYRLEDHVRLHIDPNAFKCDLCHKKFREGRNLLMHKRIVHAPNKKRKPRKKLTIS